MKIVFNTYPLAFDCPGGGEVQLLQTKAALESLGHSVKLFDLWNPQVRDADIVHHFTTHAGADVFVNYVKSLNKPLAVSPILYPHKDTDHYPMLAINHLLVSSDIIFPNSNIEADLLAKTFSISRDKFHVVYNGVDDSFVRNPLVDASMFRLKFNLREPYLLCVGNIEHRKNQLKVVEALQGTSHKLVLIGNIRDQNYFDEIMKVASGQVIYLGYLPHDSDMLKSAYLGCELLVLASTLETPGLAALEAGAMGTKIVITEIGATKEYFGPYADYVDPDSLESIRGGIETGLRAKKSDDLKLHIRKQFTWLESAKQTVEGYKKILGR